MNGWRDKCPACGTVLVNTGAPIWEDYCPNKECTHTRDEFQKRLRETIAATQETKRIAALAPEMLSILRFLVCIDFDHFTERDELLLDDTLRDAKAIIERAASEPAEGG